MSVPGEPRTRGGLGAMISATRAAGPEETPGGREGEKARATVKPAPPPRAQVPEKVGNAEVRIDAKGRPYIKKTLNFPLDLGSAIQSRVGSHRRASDGQITYDYQDVALDAVRLGLEVLERRERDGSDANDG